VIPGCPYVDTGTLDGDNDCSVISASPYDEVFYTFTPTVSGLYQFRVKIDSTTAPAIRIVSGACCSGAVAVGFGSGSVATDCPRPDSAGNEPTTRVTYARAALTAGVQYWIHVPRIHLLDDVRAMSAARVDQPSNLHDGAAGGHRRLRPR
jgi:hypothetical protein